MTLVVTQVTTPEQLEIAKAIRVKVFVQEVGFKLEGELDHHDVDPTTLHFLGTNDEQPEDIHVAAARVTFSPDTQTATIGRLSVRQDCRGKRYGLQMMQAIEGALLGKCATVLLSARYVMRGFYEKCGYQCLNDDIHYDEGDMQCWMVKKMAP